MKSFITKSNILKFYSIIIIIIFCFSCQSKTDKYLDWKKQENKSFNSLIEILGQPIDTINHDIIFKSKIRSYTDIYSPNFKTIEEVDNNESFSYEESDYNRINRMKILNPNYEGERYGIDKSMISKIGGVTYTFSWEGSGGNIQFLDVLVDNKNKMKVGHLMERINTKPQEECLTNYKWVHEQSGSLFRFNKDGSGSFSSPLFGSFTQKGSWYFNNSDVIYFNITSSSNGEGLGLKVLKFEMCKSIGVGSTNYVKQ